ncbi:MAG: hypothetical protein PHX27_04700 [Candidatus ainarchaeum sp.]|nr:hypothetical protein [Candidatus ainarchaeum sp.]
MNKKQINYLLKLVTFVIIFLFTGAIGEAIGNYFFGFFLSNILPNIFLNKSIGELLVFVGSGLFGDILFSEITGIEFELKI